jgi:hypothetical protein
MAWDGQREEEFLSHVNDFKFLRKEWPGPCPVQKSAMLPLQLTGSAPVIRYSLITPLCSATALL